MDAKPSSTVMGNKMNAFTDELERLVYERVKTRYLELHDRATPDNIEVQTDFRMRQVARALFDMIVEKMEGDGVL